MTEAKDQDVIIKRRGLMLILSSPSGAGKTTIGRRVIAEDENSIMSISMTTRPARPGEQDGIDYHFVSQRLFEDMIDQDMFLEHAKVFNHYYGTPRQPVEKALKKGKDVVFDIDWQGTQQLKQSSRDDVASIFILPPSTEELERRLVNRAQDSADVVSKRMSKAADEMSHWPEYDYIIINKNIDESVDYVHSILKAERLRRKRQLNLAEFVNDLRTSYPSV